MGSNFNLSDSARRLAAGISLSGGGTASVLRSKGVYALIAVLVLVGLSLPPISLPARILGNAGCTALSDQSPTLNHPDGLTITALPGSALNVKLASVPQADLAAGNAGGDLKLALQALPANLTIKSPLYQIGVCGERKAQATLSVIIPNDAEPWDTLDLYTWTGQAWQWVGSAVDMANEIISAQVGEIPANVVVVQTGPVAPAIATAITQPSSNENLALVNEVILPGLTLGSMGQIQGSVASLSTSTDASFATIPAVRNWAEGGKVNVGLVMDTLGDASVAAEHVKQLTAVVANTPYAGLQIDYRGVPEQSRAAYSDFIAKLAAALHKENKLLSVVLPPPAPTAAGAWDTAGYDWRAIGAAADAIVLQLANDPTAFGPNGQAVQMVRWATSQINRYKLQLSFSALSQEHAGGQVTSLAYADALKLFGAIAADNQEVAPGSPVTLKLDGNVQNVVYDQASKVYHLTSGDQPRTVYLITAAAIGERLNLAARYNLRGVMIDGLLGPAGSTDARLASILQQYQDKAAPALPGALQVMWTVRSQAGTQLPGGTTGITNTQYVWNAPATPGQYIVAAAIPGAASRGELPINVVAATPTPLPTPTPTPGPQNESAAATPAGGACLNAAYVADVTVPDGSKYDKGASFTKTWKVKNTGTCDWKTGVALAFQSGEKMDAPDSVLVGEVKAGAEIEISVPMKSPAQDGNYKGVWRMKDANNQFFGQVLTVVIVSGQPPVAEPPPNIPARPIVGGGFEIGGHVAGFDRLDAMKRAGMKWIKIQVRGGGGADLVGLAHANGFNILLAAVGDKGRVMSPDYQNEYAQWVASLAAAGADAIEVWNEPNIDHEWPVGQINGANYTTLLAKAYGAIKNANAGTMVISAALAPTGYFATGCADNGCNDDVFLSQMAAAGAARYADCIGAHHNAGATSPSATSGHPAGSHYSWYFWPTLNLYYNAFGGARKVCFTEFGYLSDEGYQPLESAAPNFAWAKDVTVGQQAAWLAEAASLSSSSGKVRMMIVWNVDFTYYGSDPQAGYAIIRPGGSCPACDTLGQVMGSR